jgi:anti-sigma factor RsiW
MAIDCGAALERLLEADAAELEGRGDYELAAHVRGCARCGAIAARLVRGQAELARALDALGPRVGVEDALAAARLRQRAAAWRRTLGWATPLAAAAVLAGVLLLRGWWGAGPTMPGEMMPRATVAIEPLVEMPAARNVLVFETKDQSAKVIWFY